MQKEQLALIEPLEDLEAPGWGEWAVGIGVGVWATGGAAWAGVVIGVAIT
ncbi:hypothetical protein MN032_08210 [Agromyces atrinae]|uniref:U3 small nucleolar RNA-associated protein 14 n=1 Tax=Agromyces atrinae TaxID=592376 RepID=A0A852S0Z1_9MICO|nr:hypothetical protein [Agromyces atrinae]MCI2957673.1 hypothetical protein [Agromyces atrinae]NYD67018.1 U3 small nucleolar RNA-associated protein 14 [Agromyces atrinae]